jgi:hypothetical protein
LSYRFEAIGAGGRRAIHPQTSARPDVALRVSSDRKPPTVELDRVAAASPGQSLRVSARVNDPSGVRWVRLRYRHLTQFEDYETVEMTFDARSGRYAGIIPGEFVVPRWDVMYFVEALDREGNGRMFPDLETEMPYVIVRLDR